MMTREEYNALANEPMTQERYDTLLAHYNLAPAIRGCLYGGDYDYETYGQKPQYRIHQLRVWARTEERKAAQTPAQIEAARQADIEALRRFEQSTREERELDRGN